MYNIFAKAQMRLAAIDSVVKNAAIEISSKRPGLYVIFAELTSLRSGILMRLKIGAIHPQKWPGENLLGFALMTVRKRLAEMFDDDWQWIK